MGPCHVQNKLLILVNFLDSSSLSLELIVLSSRKIQPAFVFYYGIKYKVSAYHDACVLNCMLLIRSFHLLPHQSFRVIFGFLLWEKSRNTRLKDFNGVLMASSPENLDIHNDDLNN